MRVTAQISMWGSVVFTLVCLYVGFSGLSQLDAIADQAARRDGRGFALFWIFLGAIGIACAIASWWLARRDDATPR
jgi:L-lactate permease